jgi:hypothetical protein
VLLSPNMTYPKAVRGATERVLAADTAKRTAAQAGIAAGDAAKLAAGQKMLGALDKAAAKAKTDIERVRGQKTSMVGLEKRCST